MILVFMGVLMFSVIPGVIRAQAPATLKNPNLDDPDNYVCDPYNMLSRRTVEFVNEKIAEVRRKTSAEIAVAVVHDLDGMTREDYAITLFREWGLGKKDKNNGVLLMIATVDRQCFIQVGSGMEGVLPDISCGHIIRRFIIPQMKDNNINQAVAGGVNEIALVLTDPTVAEEIKSDLGASAAGRFKTLDSEVFLDFLILFASLVFLFSLGMLLIDLFQIHNKDNYRRAMTLRNHLATYWWTAILSFGAALPIALIAYFTYKRARNVREVCDTCGALMNKLSEEDDNAYLSGSQDFEEKLGTVDYDVWLCPDCGTVARFPYTEKQLKYQRCPQCHTIAMSLVMDKVVVEPTLKRPGHGEKLYRCQYCNHERREGYSIPKKDNGAAFLGAAVALGSVSGHGGGGFSGGGFGGGSTSGGGAGGSW